jgi:8-oxo-dGTP diphosphatase
MLYFGEIARFGPLPQLEIEKVELFDALPERWTYPMIQPRLIEKCSRRSCPVTSQKKLL